MGNPIGQRLSRSLISAGLTRRLRQAREEVGLTLEQVAEKLSVSPHTVWRWESGKHEPSKEWLDRLSEVLDRPPEWFVRLDGTGRGAPDEDDALVRRVRRLTMGQRELLDRFLDALE